MQSRPALLIPLPIIFALLALVSILVSVPAFPATFAVDPKGNDANPGDSTAPWRTIQHAATIASAGDTVVIRAGSYSESVSLTRSGAAGNPIVFTADPGAVLVSPNPTASIEAFNVAAGVGFITLSGIEATGGYDETIFLRSGAHDIQIDGCNLHEDRAGIIMADAFNVTVDNCALHNNSHLGMRLVGTTHDVLVSDTDSFANGIPSKCSAKVDGFTSSSGGVQRNVPAHPSLRKRRRRIRFEGRPDNLRSGVEFRQRLHGAQDLAERLSERVLGCAERPYRVCRDFRQRGEHDRH